MNGESQGLLLPPAYSYPGLPTMVLKFKGSCSLPTTSAPLFGKYPSLGSASIREMWSLRRTAEEEVVEDAVVEASAFGRSKLIRKPEKNLVKRVQEMKVIREREINAQKGTCSETLNLSR